MSKTNACEKCPYLKNCIKEWTWLINLNRMFDIKPEETLAKLTFHHLRPGMTPSVEWMLEQIERGKDAAMKEYVL